MISQDTSAARSGQPKATCKNKMLYLLKLKKIPIFYKKIKSYYVCKNVKHVITNNDS